MSRADGKMHRIEVGRELFFKGERHGLRDARTTAYGKIGSGERRLGRRQDDDRATALGERQRVIDRPALHGAGTSARAIHDEP
jgi:hypothetical protein